MDLWDEKIRDLDPWNISDTHPDNKSSNYKSLTESEFNELRNFYNSLEKDFASMIGNAIEIGTGNLYGSAGKYSNESLKPILDLINIAKHKHKEMPDIKGFEFSKFSEQHGWGNRFDKEILK